MRQTPELLLTQYDPTDKPNYLVNYNQDNEKIDNAIKGLKTDNIDLDTRLTNIEQSLDNGNVDLGTLQTRVEVLENQNVVTNQRIDDLTGELEDYQSVVGNQIAGINETNATQQLVIGNNQQSISNLQNRVDELENGGDIQTIIVPLNPADNGGLNVTFYDNLGSFKDLSTAFNVTLKKGFYLMDLMIPISTDGSSNAGNVTPVGQLGVTMTVNGTDTKTNMPFSFNKRGGLLYSNIVHNTFIYECTNDGTYSILLKGWASGINASINEHGNKTTLRLTRI